jgi:hypothetical protein
VGAAHRPVGGHPACGLDERLRSAAQLSPERR